MQTKITGFKTKTTLRVPHILLEDETIVQAMVPSRNIPELWYTVTHDKNTLETVCDCPGFQYRGQCSHINLLQAQSYKPARRRGVQDTSISAYVLTESSRNTWEKKIYKILLERGAMSIGQLAEITGLPPGRVSARLNGLKDKDLVTDCGKQHLGYGGKLVYVWRAVDGRQ